MIFPSYHTLSLPLRLPSSDRWNESVEQLQFPLRAGNIFDDEWMEPAFKAYELVERGGVKVAVIGQAFPYTPIANPRWMIPNWSFGIREEEVAKNVERQSTRLNSSH